MSQDEFGLNQFDADNSILITNTLIKGENLAEFKTRKETVQKIIDEMVKKEKLTVNLNLENVDAPTENLERFLIEFIPRLKEIGGHIMMTNNQILSSTFLSENGI